MLFGLCLFIDVLGLLEYAPLWFDPVPFVERGSAWARPLLGVWLLATIGLTLGAFTRVCALVNYISCVVFMGFYAMPASCEFHLDPLYLLTSSALLLPTDQQGALHRRLAQSSQDTLHRPGS